MVEIVEWVENKQSKHWKLGVASEVREAKSGAFFSWPYSTYSVTLTSMPTSDWEAKGEGREKNTE